MVLEKQVPAPDQQLFERIAIGKNLGLINQTGLSGGFNTLIFLIQSLPTMLYSDLLDGIVYEFLHVKPADNLGRLWKASAYDQSHISGHIQSNFSNFAANAFGNLP